MGLFSLNECSLIQSHKPANERFPWLLVRFSVGSGTAGAPLGLLQQGGPGNPTTPSQLLISHPDSSRLRAQDAAGQLLLLAPTITVSI